LTSNKKEHLEREFDAISSKYESVRESAIHILSRELVAHGLTTLSIQSRVKAKASLLEKADSSKYANPLDEITDIVGLRVICYLESEIDKVADVIKACFEVDEVNSVDKRQPESVRSVGYRSLHLICSLGSERNGLPEYQHLCSIKFEIQLRTVLQHAWAEVEHKQNYKSPRSLPSDLQRRLFILAGNLEGIDAELSRITEEAAIYTTKVENDPLSAKLDELSVSSLNATLTSAIDHHGLKYVRRNIDSETDLIEELERFGIKTVGQLSELLSETMPILLETKLSNTDTGLIRHAMILKDEKKFYHTFANNYSFHLSSLEKISEIMDSSWLLDRLVAEGEHIIEEDYEE